MPELVSDRQRQLTTVARLPQGYVQKNGRRLLSFADNDYAGLSFHPALQKAAVEALLRYGAGAGASRYVSGNHPLYAELEATLCQFKGVEAALVFGSGYQANTGVIPALASTGDLILADRLSHASLIDGIRLSGAAFGRFRHNDIAHLRQLLTKKRKSHARCLIVTESVFSMDGDVAPLAELHDLAKANDALLLVDDAHGFGVLAEGRGGVHAAGIDPASSTLIQIGTFSKAAGSYGGYVCANHGLIQHITNYARSAIYTTGLPPSVIAANMAAIVQFIEQPERCQMALEHARYFTQLLGFPMAESTIVPIVIGSNQDALGAALMLEQQGFWVVAIRPPTVPEGTARLRFAFSAEHRKDDIAQLAQCILTQPWLMPT